ncbi:polyprenyl synthetase family protein [Amycolatopsis japonica]
MTKAVELFLLENAQDVAEELVRRWDQSASALDAVLHYATANPGKMLRPIMLIESARSVGSRLDDVLLAAAGVEMGHVASLIHDDIIDDDTVRRGLPAVHASFGLDKAIVAGDALIFQMFGSLAESAHLGVSHDRIVASVGIFARSGMDMCHGQMLEAEITEQRSWNIDSYLRMISLKTARLFRGSCESGATLGGGDDDSVRALGNFGEALGIAFQIRDDMLPFVSEDRTAGKSGLSDLRNGRLTLPLLLAYRDGDSRDRQVLEDALGSPHVNESTLADVSAVLRTHASLEKSSETARSYVAAAKEQLAGLAPTDGKHKLLMLADETLNRLY